MLYELIIWAEHTVVYALGLALTLYVHAYICKYAQICEYMHNMRICASPKKGAWPTLVLSDMRGQRRELGWQLRVADGQQR